MCRATKAEYIFIKKKNRIKEYLFKKNIHDSFHNLYSMYTDAVDN